MTARRPSAGLYLVATPIGSARDISLRALDILATAEVIAAEDTRTARKLMAIHGIELGGRQMLAIHDHNERQAVAGVLAALAEAKVIAYVSEAGTPLIADPGFALSRAASEAGYAVHAAPGASAILAALCVAGLPTDRFMFAGFPPPKQEARRKFIAELASIQSTLVLYESPKRVAALLGDLVAGLGADRPAAVCRELTKKFEEVRRGTLQSLNVEVAENGAGKGEFVVVIGPPETAKASEETLDAALQTALRDHRTKEAAQMVAEALGLPRKQVYARALELLSGD